MNRYDEAFEALRAADPAKGSPAADPHSAQARAMFSDIVAQPREIPLQRTPNRRRRLLIAVAIGLLLLVLTAAAWLVLRDVTDPISVACYESASLDSNIAGASAEGSLGPDLCRSAWEDGRLTNTDIVPAGQVPPLIACVADQGILAVFPSSDQALCSALGLAEPNPESLPAGNDIRQLNDEFFTYFDQQDCRPIEQSTRDLRRILNNRGLSDWQIQVSPGGPDRPCASYALDAPNMTIRIVPIPRRGKPTD